MAKYDTVIFDMDGTILDTLDDMTDSVNYVMEKHGFPARTKAEVKNIVGNGVASLVQNALPDGISMQDFNTVLQEYIDHYKSNMFNKTAPFPGIPALLCSLQAKGYNMAVVSNKLHSAVVELNRVFFSETIPVAIGQSEDVHKKPAPDSVFKALKELGASPGKALYVGDSEVDVQTARNAGLVSVGITWGLRDRSVIMDAGADFIIDAPQDLLRILDM